MAKNDDFYDSLTPESFGVGQNAQPGVLSVTPVTPQPRRTSRWLLFGCAGCLSVVILCCCCYLVMAPRIARQPYFMVYSWWSLTNVGFWDFAETYVCTDSQAMDVTRELKSEGSKLSQFNITSTDDDEVTVEATFDLNGETRAWNRTFYLREGGETGKCIDRIE